MKHSVESGMVENYVLDSCGNKALAKFFTN